MERIQKKSSIVATKYQSPLQILALPPVSNSQLADWYTKELN